MTSSSYAIGIDIGGTNTKVVLTQKDGQVLSSLVFSTNDYTYLSFVEKLASVIDELESKVDGQILGVGIGVPNANSHGQIAAPPNLSWGSVDLNESLSSLVSLPLFFYNDANCAALLEWMFGGAKNCQNFAVITLGTGVGAGIVSQGKLLLGHSQHAGEFGHMIIEAQGRQCACGGYGHLEAYLSAAGIERTIEEVFSRTLSLPDFSKIFAKNKSNNLEEITLANTVIEKTADYLALALANLCAITSPEKILLCGGVSRLGEPLLLATQKKFDHYLFHSLKGTVDIETSSFDQELGASLGAAAGVFLSQN